MLALDSPALADGLDAWVAWSRELAVLHRRHAHDRTVLRSVAAEEQRTTRVIEVLQRFPNGLNVQDPSFRRTVRELSAV